MIYAALCPCGWERYNYLSLSSLHVSAQNHFSMNKRCANRCRNKGLPQEIAVQEVFNDDSRKELEPIKPL